MRFLLLYLAITLQVLRQTFSFTRVQLSLEEDTSSIGNHIHDGSTILVGDNKLFCIFHDIKTIIDSKGCNPLCFWGYFNLNEVSP